MTQVLSTSHEEWSVLHHESLSDRDTLPICKFLKEHILNKSPILILPACCLRTDTPHFSAATLW